MIADFAVLWRKGIMAYGANTHARVQKSICIAGPADALSRAIGECYPSRSVG
jgi:hypothetical protein